MAREFLLDNEEVGIIKSMIQITNLMSNQFKINEADL